jgi:hypothetical protein
VSAKDVWWSLLLRDATGQNPGDCPFLIFIDVNLPLTPDVPLMQKEWVKEALQTFDYREQEERKNLDTGPHKFRVAFV